MTLLLCVVAAACLLWGMSRTDVVQEALAAVFPSVRAAHLAQLLDAAELIVAWRVHKPAGNAPDRLLVSFQGRTHLVAVGAEIAPAQARLEDARAALAKFVELTTTPRSGARQE